MQSVIKAVTSYQDLYALIKTIITNTGTRGHKATKGQQRNRDMQYTTMEYNI